MRTRLIPATGEALPVLGLGTYQSFDGPAHQVPGLAAQLRALDGAGGRLVDTSPMYGRAEARLGEAVRAAGLGGRLFLATKVWTQGREAGLRQVAQSMQLLGGGPLDLVQVHNLVDWQTHLPGLRALQAEGHIRHLGITHYHASAHEAVAQVLRREPLQFLQINYSLAEPQAAARLLPLARERGVAVIANRPFAQGEALARLRRRPLPGTLAQMGFTGWAQVLLAWVLLDPDITCAIPATSDPQHLADNLAAEQLARGLDAAVRPQLQAACALD